MPALGTYRSACGSLLHRRVEGDGGVRWVAEDDRGCRPVELAWTATPRMLSDDPDWPCGPERFRDAVLEPD